MIVETLGSKEPFGKSFAIFHRLTVTAWMAASNAVHADAILPHALVRFPQNC